MSEREEAMKRQAYPPDLEATVSMFQRKDRELSERERNIKEIVGMLCDLDDHHVAWVRELVEGTVKSAILARRAGVKLQPDAGRDYHGSQQC